MGCINDYLTVAGKKGWLKKPVDENVSKGKKNGQLPESEQRRKLILEEHRELFDQLNDLKQSIGVKDLPKYEAPLEPNQQKIAGINAKFDDIINDLFTNPNQEQKKEQPRTVPIVVNETEDSTAQILKQKREQGKKDQAYQAVWDQISSGKDVKEAVADVVRAQGLSSQTASEMTAHFNEIISDQTLHKIANSLGTISFEDLKSLVNKYKNQGLSQDDAVSSAFFEHRSQVEESKNIEPAKVYTADNINTISTEGLNGVQTKVIADVKNVVSAVGSLVKDLAVHIHTDPKTYTDAVVAAGGTQQDSESKGFYMSSDGTIHLNMDRVTSETMLHEGFHPILDYIEKHNPGRINEFFEQLKAIDKSFITTAEKLYSGDTTIKKEAITDFVAKVADGSFKIDPTNYEKVKDFIVKMLNKLGFNLRGDINSIDDLKVLARIISQKFNKGESITNEKANYINSSISNESSVGANVDIDLNDIKGGSSGRGIQLSKEGDTLSAVKVSLVDPADLGGVKIARTLFYDNTRVGKTSVKNRLTGFTPDIDGKGGFFYSYMPEALKNKAVLAFTSIEQSIQTLQRQIMFPDAAMAVASQNVLTAHLGNLTTLRTLFGNATTEGIFQNAVKNSKEEKELVKAMMESVTNLSKLSLASGQLTPSAAVVDRVLKSLNGKSVSTVDQFRDNVLLGEGDSFGTRGIIFKHLLQEKLTTPSKSTRPEHVLLHHKFGIPTQSEIAEGNNQPHTNNAETGDVVKLVKLYNEPIMYTTDESLYEYYKKNPTPIMIEAGLKVELLPNELHHESYPFVLRGENVGVLKSYIAATQMYKEFEHIPKKQGFYNVGRMRKDSSPGEIRKNAPTEGSPQFSKVESDKIKSEAIANGTFMKAPNGKDSNLNEKQWVQVRTEPFKSWFGDWETDAKNASKVVDVNGEPMVVYHGGANRIKIFDKNKINKRDDGYLGKGFYFSSEKVIASSYQDKKSDTIYEVFLNLKNPLSLEKVRETPEQYAPIINDTVNQERKERGYIEKNFTNEIIDDLKQSHGGSYGTSSALDPYTDLDKIAKFGGFDGIVSFDEHVVFEPNQIKSATDNIGTFDNNNNNIQFSRDPSENQAAKSLMQDKFGDVMGVTAGEYLEQLATNDEIKSNIKNAPRFFGANADVVVQYLKTIQEHRESEHPVVTARREGTDGPVPSENGVYLVRRASIDELMRVVEGEETGTYWTTAVSNYTPSKREVTMLTEVNRPDGNRDAISVSTGENLSTQTIAEGNEQNFQVRSYFNKNDLVGVLTASGEFIDKNQLSSTEAVESVLGNNDPQFSRDSRPTVTDVVKSLSDNTVKNPLGVMISFHEGLLNDTDRTTLLTGVDRETLDAEGMQAYQLAYELYLKNGTSNNSRVDKVFDKFTKWMSDTYNMLSINVGAKISPQSREVFNNIIGTKKVNADFGSTIKESDRNKSWALLDEVLVRTGGQPINPDSKRTLQNQAIPFAEESFKVGMTGEETATIKDMAVDGSRLIERAKKIWPVEDNADPNLWMKNLLEYATIGTNDLNKNIALTSLMYHMLTLPVKTESTIRILKDVQTEWRKAGSQVSKGMNSRRILRELLGRKTPAHDKIWGAEGIFGSYKVFYDAVKSQLESLDDTNLESFENDTAFIDEKVSEVQNEVEQTAKRGKATAANIVGSIKPSLNEVINRILDKQKNIKC